MQKILLFGASGNLGKAIAREAAAQGYHLTAVVRTREKARALAALTPNHLVADVTHAGALRDICRGFDVVISALGKSVSPNDKSKSTFYEVDFLANSRILEEARRSGVAKFVYVSAFGAEDYPHLAYFKVHHDFSEKLKASGLNYSIIKPPALFSAYLDMIPMARKGQLVSIGRGERATNPIYEGDLARVCLRAISMDNEVVEAGGKNIYTRKQLLQIIQRAVAPQKSIRQVPLGVVRLMLPLVRVVNRNLFDKVAFFVEVMGHDVVAPLVGEMSFEEYIALKTKEGQPVCP